MRTQHHRPTRRGVRDHSSEKGMALIMALFMVLVLSVLGSSLMFISQSETWSSSNYRLTSQARYAAESGVHRAANFLLQSTSYTSPGGGGDPLSAYNMTVSPVRDNATNSEIVLSSDTSRWAANYPVAQVQTDFANTVQGELNLNGALATYRARARLLSMQNYTDQYSYQPRTIQTWEITAVGTIGGNASSTVEVSAVIERQLVPFFRYAAFATHNGCAALSFAGGAGTDSYDSLSYANGTGMAIQNSGGNVGTNGNLTEVGNPTVINGTLSTPRSGVGNCTANNVTALTVNGNPDFHVTGGLVELSQAVNYETPTLDATPTQIDTRFQTSGSACPTGVTAGTASCGKTSSGGTDTWTVTPASAAPVIMGDVRVNSGVSLKLRGGTYVINSITLAGNATLEIEPGTGPVILQVAGQSQATPIDLTGGGVVNPSRDPSLFKIVYPGTGTVKLAGNADAAALVYAPNASTQFVGNTDFYGAVITKHVTATGGMTIHYDRRLQQTATTASNPMMSSFTWKTF